MFYVYAHFRCDTNAMFYVGKGKNKRAYACHNRNKHWKHIVKKAEGFEAKILLTDSDEEFAYFAEQEAINVYIRRGEKLVNMTDGGDGMYGVCQELRNKITESNKRRAGEKRQKATFIGKTHSDDTKQKMAKSQKQRFANKVVSEETKQKMREAQARRFLMNPISEETKQKMSMAKRKKDVCFVVPE